MVCPKCGKETGDAVFCPHCGGALTTTAAPSSTQSGMAENVAGLLCYLVGWVTGIIFFIIDKRPIVRFHAMQSIITFGALSVIYFIIGFLPFTMWRLMSFLYSVLSLAGLVLWILLMVKAYQGKQFKLPIAGNIAQNMAENSK